MNTLDFGVWHRTNIVRKNPDTRLTERCKEYFFSRGYQVRAWEDGTMIVKSYIADEENNILTYKEYLFLASNERILHQNIFNAAKAAIADYCNARRLAA
jgi:hypothetical protein